MNRIAVAAVAALSLLGIGCAGFLSAPVVPPLAFVYTGVEAPLDTELERTNLGSKRGQASVVNILGIVSTGDASAKAAAEDGGIQTIHHADYEFFNVLGVFSRYTTIVYGD